ncbi:hypothetical protein PR048_016113, partial [Dryococelus australis]
MTPAEFEDLLNKVWSFISKQETRLRSPISAQNKLAATLRFLATGDSYTSLQYFFSIPKQSFGKIFPDVCAAIVQELKGHVNVRKESSPINCISRN